MELKIEKHVNPYKTGWIKKGIEMMVNEVCTIQLSIGRHHQDKIHCDVVDMTACHLLLGRLWQFDRNVVHKGKDNTYKFCWKEKKIILVPTTHKPN